MQRGSKRGEAIWRAALAEAEEVVRRERARGQEPSDAVRSGYLRLIIVFQTKLLGTCRDNVSERLWNAATEAGPDGPQMQTPPVVATSGVRSP